MPHPIFDNWWGHFGLFAIILLGFFCTALACVGTCVLLAVFSPDGNGETGVSSPVAGIEVNDTPTNTQTATISAELENTPELTNTPTATSTTVASDTPAPTRTPEATRTPTPTSTPSHTSLPTATDTPIPTTTPTATNTPTATELPRPSNTPSPTTGPSRAVELYAAEIFESGMTLSEALANISFLASDPQFFDEEWRFDVALQIAIIQLVHEDVKQMDVPPEMVDIHRKIVDGTQDCSKSMDYLASGLDNFNVSDVEKATELMDSCADKIVEATEMIEDYLSDF